MDDDLYDDDGELLEPEDLTDDEIGFGRPLPPSTRAARQRRARERRQRFRSLPDDEPVPAEPEVMPAGIGSVLRAVRWRTGLNQRELADAAEVPRSSLATFEAEGESDLKLSTLLRLVGVAGLRLAVVDEEGTHLAVPFGQDQFHDGAYRLLPAHRETYDPRTGYWWGKGLLQQPYPNQRMPRRVHRGRRQVRPA